MQLLNFSDVDITQIIFIISLFYVCSQIKLIVEYCFVNNHLCLPSETHNLWCHTQFVDHLQCLHIWCISLIISPILNEILFKSFLTLLPQQIFVNLQQDQSIFIWLMYIIMDLILKLTLQFQTYFRIFLQKVLN